MVEVIHLRPIENEISDDPGPSYAAAQAAGLTEIVIIGRDRDGLLRLFTNQSKGCVLYALLKIQRGIISDDDD
jgi:hypothetical protein